MTDPQGTVAALGESTLTGWRGAVGNAVAKPVAKRTRFTEEQIRVALGLALLAYGLYRVLWPPIRAVMRSRDPRPRGPGQTPKA